jgi:hypothetical protein
VGGTQLTGEIRAHEAGHHLVSEDEVDVVALEQIEGLSGGSGGEDGVAAPGEHHLPQRSRYVFIVDTQDDGVMRIHSYLLCSDPQRFEQSFLMEKQSFRRTAELETRFTHDVQFSLQARQL